MKIGSYFRIPERPADVDWLWDHALPITSEPLPAWLTWEDVHRYRRLPLPQQFPESATAWENFHTELAELEEIGIIVEKEEKSPEYWAIFIKREKSQEVWSIGIYTGTSSTELAPPNDIMNPMLTRDDVTDVPATFVADPFMIHVNSLWYMFFEIMNWKTWKGEIGLATSSDGLAWNYKHVVLSEPFHLSYPYVFSWEGSYYLIPESHQAGGVRLYRATNFPTNWEYIGPLLEGPYLADASVFQHDGRWWIFVDSSPKGEHDTLRLFFADELLGPWHEHPQSPVVQENPRDARPAGRILVKDGQIIRFAQNSIPNYGTDVRAFVITELTPTTYAEHPLGQKPILGPSGIGWNADGMHHVDLHQLADGRWLAAVDGWYQAVPQR